MDRDDEATIQEMLHPGYVGDYPQSRERFRGFEAIRKQLRSYPGGSPSQESQAALLFEPYDQWLITPGYTVLPVVGPERFTAVVRARYPDGSIWHVITMVELLDGRVHRTFTYYAPEYERPAWREGMTELVPMDGPDPLVPS